jgi:hypothetical protein
MKSRMQAVTMVLSTIALALSSVTAVPVGRGPGSSAPQSPSKHSLRFPVTAPHLGGTVPPCPTGSTCG